MSLINNVHNLCLGKNIFISNLEKELGFSNGAIYRWDTSVPSIDKVLKVAQYFDVSVDSLISQNQKVDNASLNVERLTDEIDHYQQQMQLNKAKISSLKRQLKWLQKKKQNQKE